MRQKAEKLEKGKWYADFENVCSFLKFSHTDDNKDLFSDSIHVDLDEYKYDYDLGKFISFSTGWDYFTPTQEDREKYNLVDDE